MAVQRKKSAQDDTDYDTAMEMTALIAATLIAAIKSLDSTQYVKEFKDSLESKSTLAEAAIAINLPNLELGKLHKPSMFSEILEKYFCCISSTQLSRALSALTLESKLKNITGKTNIKEAARKLRVQFESDGRASAYLLPSKLESMIRVYKNKILVDKIVTELKVSGILHLYLKSRVLPMLRVIRSDDDGAYREFASSMFTDLAADNESWNKFRGILLGINDSQLEEFAKNLTNVLEEKITELPSFSQTVLVLGFSNPESIME